jgi:uncharacterized protein (TIGR03382 family)
MRWLWATFTSIALVTAAGTASASSGGIAGYSGKSSVTCTTTATCHGGGTAPDVKLDGPTTLAAGADGEYTLTVTGTDKTGADIAASSSSAKFTAEDGLKVLNNELVHSAPGAGTATYKFKVTAPTSGAKMTLYASGLGGGSQTASSSKAITMDVAITGGSAATGDDDDSTSTTTKKSTSGDDDDDSTSSKKSDLKNADPWNDSGCNATGGSSQTWAALLVAGVLLASRRRRDPRL